MAIALVLVVALIANARVGSYVSGCGGVNILITGTVCPARSYPVLEVCSSNVLSTGILKKTNGRAKYPERTRIQNS